MAPGPVHHQQQQQQQQQEHQQQQDSQLETINPPSSTTPTTSDLQLENSSIPTQEETQVCSRLMTTLLECRLREALAAEALSNPALKIYTREFDKKSEFVTCYDRDRMVRWLCVLTHDFHFCLEVFFRATSILDSFLSVMKVRPKFLQCITMTCFFTACKLEEKPQSVETLVEDIVRNYSCSFSTQDMYRIELIIVQKLGFKLNNNNTYDFLKIFHILGLTNGSLSLPSDLSHDQHLCHTALCLEEVVSNHALMKFRPSLLALAVLGCDLKLLGCDWLTAVVTLQNLSEVRGGELSVCYETVAPIYNVVATRHPLYIGSKTPPVSAASHVLAGKEGTAASGETNPGVHVSTATETQGESKPPASEVVEEVEPSKGKGGDQGMGESSAAPPGTTSSDGGTSARKGMRSSKKKPAAMQFPKSVKTIAV